MSNTYCANLAFRDITTGDSFSFVMYASASVPQSLNGWSATAKVRSALSSASVIVTLSNPADIVLTTDSSGVATVFFTTTTKATIMAALGSGVSGVWGIELTDTNSNVYVPVEGTIVISQSVPR